jgi:ParB/RepB/Spo0J family partition protein
MKNTPIITLAVPDEHALLPGVVTEIPLALIDEDRQQPRLEFDDASLATLAADIQRRGVRQPIELRPANGRYIVETGERRVRAARRAGLATIPALLAQPHVPTALDTERQTSEDLERLLHQAAENVLRDELSVVDRARLFRRLRDEHGIAVGELPEFVRARGLGDYSRPHISNLIRLLELPDWALDAIRAGDLTAYAARPLLQILDLAPALGSARETLSAWITRVHAHRANPVPGDDLLDSDDDRTAMPTERDVLEACMDALSDHYLLVNGYSKGAPYYDLRAHADEIGLRTIGGLNYITDVAAHEALQAQHPKPHPKSPAAEYPHVHGKAEPATATKTKTKKGDTTDEKKAAPAADILKVRNVESIVGYLVAWWQRYLLQHHREPRVIHAVLSWVAAGAPGNTSLHNNGLGAERDTLAGAQHDASAELKRASLGAFLAHDLDDDERGALFDHLLPAMGRAPIAHLVTHLELTLDTCWSVDGDWLALHNKATLESSLRKMGAILLPTGNGKGLLDPDWSACRKLGEMREYCLARAEHWQLEHRVPPELTKVWADILKQAKSRP